MNRRMQLLGILAVCVLAIGVRLAQSEQAKPMMAQPAAVEPVAAGAADPAAAQAAAMAKMQELGSPNEHHQVLEPLVGTWTYVGEFRMAPDGPAQTMTGTANNSLIFGGRFLKQEITGQGEMMPAFEGIGYLGYDTIRNEYTSVWFDNMMTGIMRGAGQYDLSTKTLTEQTDFSCPMTGEAHRQSRNVWRLVDEHSNVYESYSTGPDGQEFKSMEIRYTRAQ